MRCVCKRYRGTFVNPFTMAAVRSFALTFLFSPILCKLYHNIINQPAVPVTMEGYVEKKAMTATSNKWQKRYLMLRGDTLAYFGSEKESKAGKTPRNTLVLSAKSTIKVRVPNSAPPRWLPTG